MREKAFRQQGKNICIGLSMIAAGVASEKGVQFLVRLLEKEGSLENLSGYCNDLLNDQVNREGMSLDSGTIAALQSRMLSSIGEEVHSSWSCSPVNTDCYKKEGINGSTPEEGLSLADKIENYLRMGDQESVLYQLIVGDEEITAESLEEAMMVVLNEGAALQAGIALSELLLDQRANWRELRSKWRRIGSDSSSRSSRPSQNFSSWPEIFANVAQTQNSKGEPHINLIVENEQGHAFLIMRYGESSNLYAIFDSYGHFYYNISSAELTGFSAENQQYLPEGVSRIRQAKTTPTDALQLHGDEPGGEDELRSGRAGSDSEEQQRRPLLDEDLEPEGAGCCRCC